MGNPLYSARRTLHTGADLLTDKQTQRLQALFKADEHIEAQATWGIYQRMIAAHREPDRARGRQLMQLLRSSRFLSGASAWHQCGGSCGVPQYGPPTCMAGALLCEAWRACPDTPRRGEAELSEPPIYLPPDRLIVGEVRGAEVRELLAALNTGHEGGCGTLHANTAADVVARFEALGALADLSPSAVHAQLTSAVDVVLHLRRATIEGNSARRIESMGVLVASPSGRPVVRTALRWDGRVEARGEGWSRLAQLLGVDQRGEQ